MKFTVCIPAYNRAKFLQPLLDSILAQDYEGFEILICEDKSPEREDITRIVEAMQVEHPGKIRLILNESNLGYDGNIRKLAEEATGDFCFYMGNDDLMAPRALSAVAAVLDQYKNVTYVLKSYGWFSKSPDHLDEVIRYFNSSRLFPAGITALRVGYRRAGVISGFIIKADIAKSCSTSEFDGTLYYQMHMAANALAKGDLYYIDQVLVYSRATEAPDFGNSEKEKGKYTPGQYTSAARLSMMTGAMTILRKFCEISGVDALDPVMKDYANNFYPYIKDQLGVEFADYLKFYRSLSALGFKKYPMFHAYMLVAYLLGERRFDSIVRMGRKWRAKGA